MAVRPKIARKACITGRLVRNFSRGSLSIQGTMNSSEKTLRKKATSSACISEEIARIRVMTVVMQTPPASIHNMPLVGFGKLAARREMLSRKVVIRS